MTDLVDGILFLAPGFFALKLFYVLGAQRRRSEWEWTTWSVLVSIPINLVAAWMATGSFGLGKPDLVEIENRFAVASLLGLLAVLVWHLLWRSIKPIAVDLRRLIGTSAWDETLDDVDRHRRAVEVVLDDGARYQGTVTYAGREDNEVEGWLYLTHPKVYDVGTKKFRPPRGTAGYLIHTDHIKRLRVMFRKDEVQEDDEPAVAGYSGVG